MPHTCVQAPALQHASAARGNKTTILTQKKLQGKNIQSTYNQQRQPLNCLPCATQLLCAICKSCAMCNAAVMCHMQVMCHVQRKTVARLSMCETVSRCTWHMTVSRLSCAMCNERLCLCARQSCARLSGTCATRNRLETVMCICI